MVGKLIYFFIWLMIIVFGEDKVCKNGFERIKNGRKK
jgi:hypothetical protein